MSRRANEGKVLRLNYVGAYEITKQDLVQAGEKRELLPSSTFIALRSCHWLKTPLPAVTRC
jgi:hypothetical protein